jgi:hypothetical protein
MACDGRHGKGSTERGEKAQDVAEQDMKQLVRSKTKSRARDFALRFGAADDQVQVCLQRLLESPSAQIEIIKLLRKYRLAQP